MHAPARRSDAPARPVRNGDFGDVPLAPDLRFTGPMASFESADAYRAMASEAGPAVTRFAVRRQFVDVDTVCSIVDWEMAIPGVEPMTAAELLEVRDGVIVRGELIYDAEQLRRAMALALVPVRPFRELAFFMSCGLLIDAFLVRTLLVPSLIAIVGPVSGWPGRRLHARPKSAVAAPGA